MFIKKVIKEAHIIAILPQFKIEKKYTLVNSLNPTFAGVNGIRDIDIYAASKAINPSSVII